MLGFNEGATVFAPKVKRFLEQYYAGHSFRSVGDPKGQDRGQATEQSAYDVFRGSGMPVTPAPVKANNIDTRIEAVAFALNDNPGGINRLVFSPLCRTLIVGMAGRYHLVRDRAVQFSLLEVQANRSSPPQRPCAADDRGDAVADCGRSGRRLNAHFTRFALIQASASSDRFVPA
jgi:hypothetical protein